MGDTNRFSELQQLVVGDGGLTREEARYLRLLLFDLRTDLVGESPLEIVIMIALQLSLAELAHCLRVSKVWRQQFLSGPVMAAYARLQWPAMIDGVVNRHDFLATLSKLRQALYPTSPSIEALYGKHVPWFSQLHYQLDPVFHARADDLPSDYTQSWGHRQHEQTEPSALYFSGKLAWSLKNRLIIIDDFRSETRKVFTLPSGVRHGLALQLQAFGSRLAVAVLDRLVIAWDHVDNRSYEKSLPTWPLRCATQNNRVAVVTHGGDVMVWTPGHAILQLNTSLPSILEGGHGSSKAQSTGAYVYPFFDARNSEILYLASACFFRDTNSKAMVRITVHEFLTSGHVASWSSEYEDPVTNWNNPRNNWNRNDASISEAEPRILMADYELDRSCILFFRGIVGYGGIRFAAFDKLERKLIDIDVNSSFKWTLLGGDYASSGGGGWLSAYDRTIAGRIDLDFRAVVEKGGYGVRKLRVKRNKTRPNVLTETG